MIRLARQVLARLSPGFSLGLVLAAAIALPAAAQEGTLDKIRSSGAITLGHRDGSIPFSYYDDQQRPVGYALDLCLKIVDAFHGHDHAGNHKVINGIHYYTLIAVVEGSGEANNSYAMVEVQPDLTIAVTGFRRAVTMQMPKSA